MIVAAVGVLWWGMSDPGGLWAQEQYSEPTLTLRTALELADRHSPLLSSERSLTQAARAGAIAAKDSLFPVNRRSFPIASKKSLETSEYTF